jgi:hypothetical protein
MTMLSTSAASRALLTAAALALCASLAFAQAPASPPSPDGPDPALVNLAPGDQTQTQLPGDNPQDYLQQTPAPIVRQAPNAVQPASQPDAYNAPATDNPAADNAQADANLAAGEAALDDADIDADQPPPPLPDYDQPAAPADNYIWTPGYWGYAPLYSGSAGYYWVPGAWVYPPYYGALWTPPYWGWYGGRYRWHPGYWGTHVGFYGGVNYGFGYIGIGYFGGYWAGNTFFYNRSVTTVGPGVTNVYVHSVVYNNHTYGPRPTSNVSYNGGRGGINVAPRPAELAAMHETHTPPLAGQLRLHQTAAQNPQAAFSANQGRPAVAARTNPVGANRTIAPSQSAFQSRSPAANVQNSRPTANETPRNQPAQPRPQQQSRPAPQYHPAPASHPVPPAHESKH